MKNTRQIEELITTIENLTILRDGWLTLDFKPKMYGYSGIYGKRPKDLKIREINVCGTNCCLLGKAPEMEGLEIDDSDFYKGRFNYRIYSDRLLPALAINFHRIDIGKQGVWGYIFGTHNLNDRLKGIERMTEMIAWLQFELFIAYLRD